jgi:hypothetical protein
MNITTTVSIIQPTHKSSWLKPLAILCCMLSAASSATFENLTYTDNGTSITITGYVNPPTGALVIPSNIIGKPVTSIGDNAFTNGNDYQGWVTSISIPEGVTTIGAGAFYQCSITRVTIPSSVTTINGYAFYQCYSLKSATFLGNAPNVAGYNFYPNSGIFKVFYITGNTGFTQSFLSWATKVSISPNLMTLSLNAGTLSPTFSTETTNYTSMVSNATTGVTVIPTAADSTATIKVNEVAVTSGTASVTIPLVIGTNTLTVLVTAQDETTTKTYTVAVTRPLSISTLSGLILASGSLSPTFAAATTSYTASVTNATTSITVTPTATNDTATIKVNGTTATSGVASGAITLAVGPNVIPITVTAQDGTTISTYTVTVTRADSYDAWQARAFTDPADLSDPAVSGDLATPAHDGITNLMKYALALEPLTCGTGDMPTVAQQDGYLTLTYRKNKTATDVTYTVQAVDDLTGNVWAPATSVVSQTDQGDHWLITVRDTVPYAGQSQRFMRLQVGK